MKTFLIADIGANHNGNFQTALDLIDIIAATGVDAAKFQTYSAKTLYAPNTPDFGGYKDINRLIEKVELPRWWQKDLKKACDDRGVEFISTPFDEAAIEELVELGVKRLKIAAFESSDPRFVQMCAKTQLPLIISLGITPPGVMNRDRLHWVHRENKSPDLTFLHCSSAYPTPDEDINLRTITYLQSVFNKRAKVGLSDHTMNVLTPALAVMLGATTCEFHITMSRHMEGPDHPFAREPMEVAEIVRNVRLAEKCIGTIADKITPSESSNKMAMRSVVANKPIKAGDLLTPYNTTTMRPFPDGAIPAYKYFDVLQIRLRCDVPEGGIIYEYMLL